MGDLCTHVIFLPLGSSAALSDDVTAILSLIFIIRCPPSWMLGMLWGSVVPVAKSIDSMWSSWSPGYERVACDPKEYIWLTLSSLQMSYSTYIASVAIIPDVKGHSIFFSQGHVAVLEVALQNVLVPVEIFKPCVLRYARVLKVNGHAPIYSLN